MMLVRYLSQIGKYFLMWKEIFSKQTKWSVMRGLIFKEIDDLIIDSLGIVRIWFRSSSQHNGVCPISGRPIRWPRI